MSEKIDTKAKIIQAARKLFAQKGFDGTSVRDISSAAEVNVAAINYHFMGKQQLLLSMVSADLGGIADRVSALSEQNLTFIDFISATFDIFCIDPDAIAIYYKIAMTNFEFSEIVLSNYRNFRERILIAVDICLNRGKERYPREQTYWIANTLLNSIIFDATSLTVPSILRGNEAWRLNIDQRRNRIIEMATIFAHALDAGLIKANL